MKNSFLKEIPKVVFLVNFLAKLNNSPNETKSSISDEMSQADLHIPPKIAAKSGLTK